MAPQGSMSRHYRREDISVCNECNAYLNDVDELTHMTEAHCGSYFYHCHLCRDYSGYKSSSLFQHQRDKHEVNYYYIACPICLKFSSPVEKDVESHVINVHFRIENAFVCNYCGLISKFNLNAHFQDVHSYYVCVFKSCQAFCLCSMGLFQHYMDYHFPKLALFYCCSECDSTFPKQYSLYQHKRDKHDIVDEEEEDEEDTIIEFYCPSCSFSSSSKKDYQKHTIEQHPNHFFNCSFQSCTYRTKLFWSLTQHTLDKHLSYSFLEYWCFECRENTYDKIHSLIQHLRDKHSVVEYCSYCETYEDDLSDHILCDEDHSYNVFACGICHEGYIEKEELIDHLSDDHLYITPLLRRLCFGE